MFVIISKKIFNSSYVFFLFSEKRKKELIASLLPQSVFSPIPLNNLVNSKLNLFFREINNNNVTK